MKGMGEIEVRVHYQKYNNFSLLVQVYSLQPSSDMVLEDSVEVIAASMMGFSLMTKSYEEKYLA